MMKNIILLVYHAFFDILVEILNFFFFKSVVTGFVNAVVDI
jgi:hypothetical protein